VQRITAAGESAKTDSRTSERGDPMTFVRNTDTPGPLLLLAAALLAANPAHAAPLNLPANDTVDYSIYQRPTDPSLALREQQPSTEQPGSTFLGRKLDFTDGQLQIYRFRIDKTPFNANLPRQQIDAGGIKLKWNW